MIRTDREPSGGLCPGLAAVFRAEVLAARLEGGLRADRDLAALWRAIAGVQEACASAWLEDRPVSPADLLTRSFRRQMGDPERDRAALMATGLLRGLHSPGALEADTGAVLTRIWRLAGDRGARPFEAADHRAVAAALTRADSPILGAVAVAQLVRAATEARAPAAERLAFVAADHALRGSGRFMPGTVEPHALVAAPRGAWVVQPSLALVDNGFRLWSVTSPAALTDLIAGLVHTLERGLGALPMLRRWLAQMRAARRGEHGASRLPDLLDLLSSMPIVTGAAVADRLRITPRGAQKLIDRAVGQGVLVKITPRATYRAWAVPPLAAMIGRG